MSGVLDNLERFFEIFFGEAASTAKLANSLSYDVYADFHVNLLGYSHARVSK
jgi:hypothetical protein